jgi:phage replication O-like protein O
MITIANPSVRNGFIQIANELVEKFYSVNIPGEEWRIIWALWRKTWGWKKGNRKKDWDWISITQFEKMTGMKKANVHRALKSLLVKRLIVKKENLLKFNQNHNEWLLVKRLIPLVKRLPPISQKATPALVNRLITKETLTKDTSTKDIDRAQKYFYRKYKEVFKKDYVADFGKDGKIFKDLEGFIPAEELKGIIDRFFYFNDDFIKGAGHTVGVLKGQVNKLREKQSVVAAIQTTEIPKREPISPEGLKKVRELVKSVTNKIEGVTQ